MSSGIGEKLLVPHKSEDKHGLNRGLPFAKVLLVRRSVCDKGTPFG